MSELKNFGCRFSLYPMTDNFIGIILGALEKTDTSAVYSFTDAISTVYRGSGESVLDAVSGLFVNAYTPNVHMAIEGVFSNEEETPSACGGRPNRAATKERHFNVKCKLSLYGSERAKEIFAKTEKFGLESRNISYGVRFGGDVQNMFKFIERLCLALDEAGEKFSLGFTMSVNSPTAE